MSFFSWKEEDSTVHSSVQTLFPYLENHTRKTHNQFDQEGKGPAVMSCVSFFPQLFENESDDDFEDEDE